MKINWFRVVCYFAVGFLIAAAAHAVKLPFVIGSIIVPISVGIILQSVWPAFE